MTHVHGDMIDRRKIRMSNKNFKNQNRHNYNQYANKKESTPVEEKEEVVETAEEVTEAVETAEEVTEAVETAETDEEIVEEDKDKDKEKILEAAPLYGIVNCARLNVRRGPSIDTKSVCVVESGSKLEIEYFNDEWLKVVTEDGILGYCMKKFVDEK